MSTGNDVVDVGAVLARVKRAQREISDLCHGRRRWTMSVPVRLGEDSDVVFADTACDAVALCAEVERLRDALRVERRRNVAAIKVIARHYHDDNGNLVRAYPDGMEEIGDILCGLSDDDIAAVIAEALAAPASDATTGEG